MPRMQALLLVAHGSRRNADASAAVHAHAARIRRRRLFDDVRVAFWKEPPPLHRALDGITAPDVYVVPLFLAEGYFTRQVVPRELGLDGPLTRDGPRRIHYCPPVGAHPGMERLVLRLARRTARLPAAERRRAALVLIGHGTPRSETSRTTVCRIAARLGRRADFGIVDCGFLDEEPRIEAVIERVPARHVVLVPFFAAAGWHTAETIPRDLGLAGERTERAGRTLWYTSPVGAQPDIARIVLDLARQAGAEMDLGAARR